MEKVFEDKSYYGIVNLFKRVLVKSWSTTEVALEGRKIGASWFGGLMGSAYITDDNDSLAKRPYGSYALMEYKKSTGTRTAGISAFTAKTWLRLTGTASGWSNTVYPYDAFTAGTFTVQTGTDNDVSTIPFICNVSAWLNLGSTLDCTLTNYMGFSSNGTGWGGTQTVTNWYGFHSQVPTGVTPTNFWHFYGKGDKPSYFGGDIQQPIKAITASTPPTQAELVSALGTAVSRTGSRRMVSVTGGSIYEVYSDGTNWYYNLFTVGA